MILEGLEEILKDVPPTRMEFADGLWTPGEPVKPKPSEIVRRATRSVSVVLRKLRRGRSEVLPLTQADIDGHRLRNPHMFATRRRLRFVSSARLPIDRRVGFER